MKDDGPILGSSVLEGVADLTKTGYKGGTAMAPQQTGVDLAPPCFEDVGNTFNGFWHDTSGAFASEPNSTFEAGRQGKRSTDFAWSPEPLMMMGDKTEMVAEKRDALSEL